MKTREYKQFEQISKISNIETEIKSLSKNDALVKLYQIFKEELIPMLFKLSHKKEVKRTL